MKATGCKSRGCSWPSGASLDVQPVWVEKEGRNYRVHCECNWNSYRAPLVNRDYQVCAHHYQAAGVVILENIQESKEIDAYLSRKEDHGNPRKP